MKNRKQMIKKSSNPFILVMIFVNIINNVYLCRVVLYVNCYIKATEEHFLVLLVI